MVRKKYYLRSKLVRTKTRKVLITLIVSLLTAISIFLYFSQTYNADVIPLTPATDRATSPLDLFSHLESEDVEQEAFIQWIKQRRQLYHLKDPQLVTALVELCPPADSIELSLYQAKLSQCEQQPLLAKLRSLARNNLPPFQPMSRELRISTPALMHQPSDGMAYTCFNSPLVNKVVLLQSKETKQSLEVNVVGGYECQLSNNYPDLQLNEQQVLALLSRRNTKLEYLHALVVE